MIPSVHPAASSPAAPVNEHMPCAISGVLVKSIVEALTFGRLTRGRWVMVNESDPSISDTGIGASVARVTPAVKQQRFGCYPRLDVSHQVPGRAQTFTHASSTRQSERTAPRGALTG